MFSGYFYYFIGFKSYYLDKVMNFFFFFKVFILLIEDGMEKLIFDDVKELKEFVVFFGKSV